MATTLHEVQCPKCKAAAWSRTGPRKPGAFIFKAVLCKRCRQIMQHTGQTHKHYSMRELL